MRSICQEQREVIFHTGQLPSPQNKQGNLCRSHSLACRGSFCIHQKHVPFLSSEPVCDKEGVAICNLMMKLAINGGSLVIADLINSLILVDLTREQALTMSA